MWGVRDHRTAAEYGDAVLGGRRAIPQMLERFEQRGIRATWATVGFLFARTRGEILDHAPRLRATYAHARLSPYSFIESGLGRDEADDPLYFGRSLLDRIANTQGQEIATHSFSHFCCLESGHSAEAFSADLAAARDIAEAAGHAPRSIVFARNQMDDASIAVAAERGFGIYRGSPPGFAYRPRSSDGNTRLVRMARLLDSVVPAGKRADYQAPALIDGHANIAASRFLRPIGPKFPLLAELQTRRILKEMEAAAQADRVYHLWWHPHNFGVHADANLRRLDRILDGFAELHDKYGMRSCAMADFAPTGTRQ
jgi:peptidoglycan/xylan/chitin deacetylase (PgdA/CDA1 family)